jgi:hypothetical protein
VKAGRDLLQLRRAPFFVAAAVLYLAAVLLWFKGNFSALHGIRISPLVPLVGLAALAAIQAVAAFRRRPNAFRFRFRRAWAVPLLLILFAMVVRVPFLLHPAGLIDSDEAISLLQGKHIAEGKVPPIYYYGSDYQGTLSQHVTALGFLLFGYSPLLAKIVALLFYAAFLAVLFNFLRELFSARFALQAVLILALPIDHLIFASLEIASAFSLVFLLSALILLLTLRIVRDGRESLVGPLGFVMGLAFWAHPLSGITIAVAGTALAVRFRLRWRPYAVLGISFLIGMWPVLLNEAFNRFALLPFVASGEAAWMINGDKLARLTKLLQVLIFSRAGLAAFAGVIWLVGGAIMLAARAVRKREAGFVLVLPGFALFYAACYLLSGWSVTDVVRYLYLLFPVVPLLLLAPLRPVRSPAWSRLGCAALAVVLTAANLPAVRESSASVRRAESIYVETIAAMEATGIRYWSAEYWRAYALTALSGERLIVRSFTMDRYRPYSLAYDNAGQGDSYVFMGESGSSNDRLSRNLESLLTRFEIPFRKTELGAVTLFYGIGSDVFPPVLVETPPRDLPSFAVEGVHFEEGRVLLTARFSRPMESDRFRISLEIPEYNLKRYRLAKGQDRIEAAISCPEAGSFTLRCVEEFGGLPIESTLREMILSASERPGPRAPGTIYFLRGISPEYESGDRRIRYCGPRAVFKVIPFPGGRETRLRLSLESPFQFSGDPWHGEYRQAVVFTSGGKRLLQRDLRDGMNVIDLILPPSADDRPLEIVMSSSWRAWFEFAPFRRVSEVLESIEILGPGPAGPKR